MSRRVALVTGGGSGIGAATAALLARDGCAVAVTDLRADAARAVAAGLPGSGHRAYALDVAEESRVSAVFTDAEREIGPVAVLVCCAGIIISPTDSSQARLSNFTTSTHSQTPDKTGRDRQQPIRAESRFGDLCPFHST